MRRLKIHPAVEYVGKELAARGYAAYLVGGAVRDLAMGIEPTDFDVATNARPEDLLALFRRVIPTGVKHGTVTVLWHEHRIEVTTFRSDGVYRDGRRPESVEFGDTIEADLARRDFTINAMAVGLHDRVMIDPYGGQRDLHKRLLKAIGNPVDRFTEDGLRLLRACRFAAQLEFEVEAATIDGMTACAGRVTRVSAERVQDELVKTLKAPKPSVAFVLMDRTGILEHVLPELVRCKGVEQKGEHRFDVFTHSLLACDGAPRDRLDLRLAALFHDLGKPATLAYDANGLPSFHGHEVVSERMTHDIMRRLRFSNQMEETVCHLIRHHMFHYEDNWSDAAVRRFVARVGIASLQDLIDLRRADTYGTAGKMIDDITLTSMQDRIKDVLAGDAAFSLKDLAVNGNDLAEHVGIPKGPQMGSVLKELLSSVLDDPSLNTPEQLYHVAKNFYETHVRAKEPGSGQ